MERSSFSRKSPSSKTKFLRRVILPAIRGQYCPICLEYLHGRTSAVLTACNHAYCEHCIRKWSFFRRKCPLCNSDFDSWFSRISLSSGKFHRHRLPPLETTSSRNFRFEEEEEGPRRIAINSSRRRTTPVPWRRSFGRVGSVGADVIAQRKLQWRASIYERRLKAVPSTSIDRVDQNVSGNSGARERILRRIEPWVRRELQAVLGDPDPSVIVHVATSLYIATLEKKFHCTSGQPGPGQGDQFLTELRAFLLNKTDLFWHEFRCFAESSFTMETYDAVVEYTQ